MDEPSNLPWDADGGDDADRPSRAVPRTVGAALTLAALGAAFAAAATGTVNFARLFGGRRPRPIDWLFVASLTLLCWYVVVPLALDGERARRHWAAIRSDPIALVASAYCLAFVLGGTVGVALFGTTDPTLAHGHQPPAFVPAGDHVVVECPGRTGNGLCYGSFRYPLGTNGHGESMLRLMLQGMHVSLKVVTIAATIVVPVAVAVGTAAGYVGGRVDTVLMRYVDVQETVPAFLVYLVLIYVFGKSLFVFVVVFGLLSWGGVARIVRSEVRRIKREEYVLAARSQGAGTRHLIGRHLLPNVSGPVAVATFQLASRLVLVAAALSFLRLTDVGVQSWGLLISNGLRYRTPFLDVWWVSTVPAVLLTATVLSLSVVGDVLRDVHDPASGR